MSSASVKALRSLRSAPTQKARSWLEREHDAAHRVVPRHLLGGSPRWPAPSSVETAFIASGRSSTISATCSRPGIVETVDAHEGGAGRHTGLSLVGAGEWRWVGGVRWRGGPRSRRGAARDGVTAPTPRSTRRRWPVSSKPDMLASSRAIVASTSTEPAWATAVRREARLTVVPKTSPRREMIGPRAMPQRTSGRTSSSVIVSTRSSAMAAAGAAPTVVKSTSSPTVLMRRPRGR